MPRRPERRPHGLRGNVALTPDARGGISIVGGIEPGLGTGCDNSRCRSASSPEGGSNKDNELFAQPEQAYEPGPMPASDKGRSGSCLSTTQRALLGQVAESLEHVACTEQLKHCVDTTLRALLPHDQLLCGLGRLKDGRVVDPWLLNHRIPASQLESLIGPGQVLNWPLLQRWVVDRKPLLLGEEPMEAHTGCAPAAGAERPRLRDLALHGAGDCSGMFISWFCFAGMPPATGRSCEPILRVLVPHLHFALLRIRAGERRQVASRVLRLTERQLDVLQWVRLGKTNVEIGLILQTSEANVKYHLREIFRKLDVSNRAHAVTQLEGHTPPRPRPMSRRGQCPG